MKLISLVAGLCILIHTCSFAKNERLSGGEMNDFNLTTVEIIEKYGYPAETHETETQDGYILVLHRIPHGKKSTAPGFPILLGHSLLFDSAVYVLNGKKSLGFFLADEGYDVWLANIRGNHYTKSHKYLSAKDDKFWDFSLHELGVYDLPAQIDYVCDFTKNHDVLFLGYSMGSTAFFIMASERPEYQKKIKGAALLAPIAALKHSNAFMRFFFIPIINILTLLSKPHSVGGDIEESGMLQNLFKLACNSTEINRRICEYVMFAFGGVDTEGFDERTVLNLATHVSGTSIKLLEHYIQLFLTSRFQQYDYGVVGNLAVYKRPSPPEYHLESITTPMSFFVSLNDIYDTPRNLLETLRGVRYVKSVYVIPETSFTHLDFIAGKHVQTVLYPELARQIKDFLIAFDQH